MYFKSTQSVKNLTESLKIISKILIKKKIEHFVFFGTLLGLTRRKKLIKGDDDLDFYVNIKHRKKLINSLTQKRIEVLLNKTPNTTNYFLQINFKNNKKNESKIDFYFYDSAICKNFIFERWNFDGKPFDKKKILKIPKILLFPIISRKFENFTVQLPNKPELTCEYIYGDKWRNKLKKDIEYEMRIIDGKPVLVSFNHSYKKFLAPFMLKNIYINLKKIIFYIINFRIV